MISFYEKMTTQAKGLWERKIEPTLTKRSITLGLFGISFLMSDLTYNVKYLLWESGIERKRERVCVWVRAPFLHPCCPFPFFPTSFFPLLSLPSSSPSIPLWPRFSLFSHFLCFALLPSLVVRWWDCLFKELRSSTLFYHFWTQKSDLGFQI